MSSIFRTLSVKCLYLSTDLTTDINIRYDKRSIFVKLSMKIILLETLVIYNSIFKNTNMENVQPMRWEEH
jgi:hypothetical protein